MSSQIARRLVILGAPGSGKGTIASRIVKTYGMPHIVVGDLLRQHIQKNTGKCFFCKGIFLNKFSCILRGK
jgi:adenylate kinase family enzyme